MPTRLLVLGGSGFVGGALVAEGVARGWEVTTFNRGQRRPADIVGDRTDPTMLTALTSRDWDIVADTWSGAPRAVRDSAAALAGRAGRYAYISSGSVYGSPLPIGLGEDAATVAAGPDGGDGDYPTDKRGAELAVTAAFGERALIARAGSIVGPGDDVGRLLWWLTRSFDGGDVLAPGPRNHPQQFIDVRDLARFVLDDHAGTYNVVSRRGHTTMEGLLGMDTERAHAAGLRCRPVAETVAATWQWMSSLPGPPHLRADLPATGLPPAKERAALHHL